MKSNSPQLIIQSQASMDEQYFLLCLSLNQFSRRWLSLLLKSHHFHLLANFWTEIRLQSINSVCHYRISSPSYNGQVICRETACPQGRLAPYVPSRTRLSNKRQENVFLDWNKNDVTAFQVKRQEIHFLFIRQFIDCHHTSRILMIHSNQHLLTDIPDYRKVIKN